MDCAFQQRHPWSVASTGTPYYRKLHKLQQGLPRCMEANKAHVYKGWDKAGPGKRNGKNALPWLELFITVSQGYFYIIFIKTFSLRPPLVFSRSHPSLAFSRSKIFKNNVLP